MQGGGWCGDIPSGSSLYIEKSIAFTGVLSHVQSQNLDISKLSYTLRHLVIIWS